MAAKLINLNQLQLAVRYLVNYTNRVYAKSEHLHDDKYASFGYVDQAIYDLEEKIAEKAIKEHTHDSKEIMTLSEYKIIEDDSNIDIKDSLNTALGKLEYRVNNSADKEHNHHGIYLEINDTAAAAKKIENAVNISLIGEVSGSSSFDGSSDISISTSISNISSDKITRLIGYVKPDTTSAITMQDSLNNAIGKLEAALDTKQDINDVNVDGLKDYIDEQILDLIGGEDIPDTLNTLRELAAAINDDPNFYDTINVMISSKADEKHSHDLATDTESGFMSPSDKAKLDSVETSANNYIHPNTPGNKHIPEGGESGQILIWKEDGAAEWAMITPTSASDADVNDMLDLIFPITDKE